MRLAFRNLSFDRVRFAVTVVGMAFAVFLMMLEGSLLAGFARAASKVIDATNADLWITARGVPAFDVPTTLPQRFRELALGVPGVSNVQRVVSGFPRWQEPSGVRQTIIVVGADPGVGRDFPLPYLNESHTVVQPESVLVDHSDLSLLGITGAPTDVEINKYHARVLGTVDGFGSFLGSPYVFTGYVDAVRYIGLEPEETMFLLVYVAQGQDIQKVKQLLKVRLPEADVWQREEFSQQSRQYWLTQTGAGGAILTAAVLGFVVGAVIVSQTIYAMTMENLGEFATLKAMGASHWYVMQVVLVQAIVSGVVGCAVGLLVAFPLLKVVKGTVSWLYSPWWLPLMMVVLSLFMSALASLVSIRKALSVEPGRVFRA
jgi:putative ABC transport system permease protein